MGYYALDFTGYSSICTISTDSFISSFCVFLRLFISVPTTVPISAIELFGMSLFQLSSSPRLSLFRLRLSFFCSASHGAWACDFKYFASCFFLALLHERLALRDAEFVKLDEYFLACAERILKLGSFSAKSASCEENFCSQVGTLQTDLISARADLRASRL